MRHILSLLAATLSMTAAAIAPHLYVYRNDGRFDYLDAADIESIGYECDDAGAFRAMRLAMADGSQRVIPLDVIDNVRTDLDAIPDLYLSLTDYPELDDLVTEWGKSYIYDASLQIDGNGSYDDMNATAVELRGRGNSTWLMPKKPYRFKLPKKTALFGLPKAKSFALIANYIDCTHMRNAVAFEAARLLAMPFTNHAVPVRVFINGVNKGLYMLTEKVGVGSGSVDIDQTRGMMFELDTNYDEDFQFYYTWSDSSGPHRIPVMVKDPDLTEVAPGLGLTPEAYWRQWRDDFAAMADRLVGASADDDLSDIIDIDSAVDYFIVNNLAGNAELCHPKSLYMYKPSADDTYRFGPVWDFDWAYTYNGYEGYPPTRFLLTANGSESGYSFLRHLLLNRDFQERYAARWQYFVENLYPRLTEYIDRYARLIEPAARQNGLIWPDDDTAWRPSLSSYDHARHVADLKAWLDARVRFISQTRNHALVP